MDFSLTQTRRAPRVRYRLPSITSNDRRQRSRCASPILFLFNDDDDYSARCRHGLPEEEFRTRNSAQAGSRILSVARRRSTEIYVRFIYRIGSDFSRLFAHARAEFLLRFSGALRQCALLCRCRFATQRDSCAANYYARVSPAYTVIRSADDTTQPRFRPCPLSSSSS